MSAEHKLDAERARFRGQLVGRRAVRAGNERAPRKTQPRGSDAALAEPNFDHAFSGELHQRSFSEERATRASRIEMIQNRTMMRGSGQPFFSKWWWIGAIKNCRVLPNNLNETTWVMTLKPLRPRTRRRARC